MTYVMVPCPEEHADALKRYVYQLAVQASLAQWDDDRVATLFAHVSQEAQDVMTVVADAVVEQRQVTDVDVGAAVGCEPAEVMGRIHEVNASAEAGPAAPMVLAESVWTVVGDRHVERRVLIMAPTAAAVVRRRRRRAPRRSSTRRD